MNLILDIDGTLANLDHRVEYAEAEDWDTFFSDDLILQDEPIENTQEILEKVTGMAEEVYFITGRPERSRDATVAWLEEHYGIDPGDNLFMREDGDTRPSVPVKKEILEEHFADMKNLVFVDDEDGNLEMFADYGLALKAPDIWELFS